MLKLMSKKIFTILHSKTLLIPYIPIGPDKQFFLSIRSDYFLIGQVKHVLWILKRTLSLRQFF